jgi:DNA repair protein RadC
VTDFTYKHESDVIKAALGIMAAKCSARKRLASPAGAMEYFRLKYGAEPREVFVMLTLDASHRIIGEHEIARGTLDMVQAYPRELLSTALSDGADYVIFCHNHPAGNPEPSKNDCAMTAQMLPLFGACNVGIIDHIIVSREGHFSMAIAGVMDKLNAYARTISDVTQSVGTAIATNGV